MIWFEKYKPRNFESLKSHHEVVSILDKYTLENIPNLIVHGQPGHNKRTMLYCLVEHLYGKYPSPVAKTTEIEAGSSKITVSYLESDEIIEIYPSEYGYKDRFVVQSIIKEMAQTKPILSMFSSSNKKSVKLLVINEAENLSKDAQAALRRTMEVYSGHFRIVLVCSETSNLIDPIKSRCMMLRMRGFSLEEATDICNYVLEKEQFSLPSEGLVQIYDNSKGDMKRMLCLLEIMCFNSEEDKNKKVKTDYSKLKLEWESGIESISDLILASQKPETLLEIRKKLYNLLNSFIDPHVILLYIMRALSEKLSFEMKKALSAFALGYEERLKLGNKAIYHLEAFCAAALNIVSQKR